MDSRGTAPAAGNRGDAKESLDRLGGWVDAETGSDHLNSSGPGNSTGDDSNSSGDGLLERTKGEGEAG